MPKLTPSAMDSGDTKSIQQNNKTTKQKNKKRGTVLPVPLNSFYSNPAKIDAPCSIPENFSVWLY
ncbi:hypothetical protein [Yersinia pseudotuberculosis]|uniref:hypothetical protein n=1 Tax=Yersinia pseudotuberculosis TaxID=633 RepID=UPI0012D411FA|nr:hypothetical protein [Yersinia pseudotuberculosis]